MILRGSPHEIVDALKGRGFRDLYIDGGSLIQSFLREDLIDELIITTVPKVLGGGIPLFGTLDSILDFDHVETEVIQDYLVKSRFSRKRLAP